MPPFEFTWLQVVDSTVSPSGPMMSMTKFPPAFIAALVSTASSTERDENSSVPSELATFLVIFWQDRQTSDDIAAQIKIFLFITLIVQFYVFEHNGFHRIVETYAYAAAGNIRHIETKAVAGGRGKRLIFFAESLDCTALGGEISRNGEFVGIDEGTPVLPLRERERGSEAGGDGEILVRIIVVEIVGGLYLHYAVGE